MYRRALDLRTLVEERSVFLFGPRQTGKSTLVRQTFPDAAVYDLLEADTFRQLSIHPEHLRQTLEPRRRIVVVDEVQKCPPLLDEVHLLIERNRALRFAKSRVSLRDYKGLRALAEDVPLERRLVVCHEPRRRRDDQGVEIVPVQRFLQELWDGAIVR